MYSLGRWKKKQESGEKPVKRELPENARRSHMHFVGQVQGVGFRWTCRSIADDLGLTGWVKNEYDGSVTMELQGTDDQISRFFTELVDSYRRYPIRYTIDEKDDIPVDPTETEFSVRF